MSHTRILPVRRQPTGNNVPRANRTEPSARVSAARLKTVGRSSVCFRPSGRASYATKGDAATAALMGRSLVFCCEWLDRGVRVESWGADGEQEPVIAEES